METLRLCVDASRPEASIVGAAAGILARGGLVAFPTETVYGLGARAGDGEAARRIFEAKERPATSALIVHVSGIEQARRYAQEWGEAAERLARAFWPGPLSLVMARSSAVPDVVAAGGRTVAMRAPAHPVALALIEALGEGIAAPSANRSSRLPPVRASHVLKGLDGRIEAVVDAGMCPGGLESTVLLLEGGRGRVLRRGAIAVEVLREHVEV
ncbi:MAG TPA: L-threonylcarbamoyladenylate synthase, partial [Polyangiaceae bacterium]|nr:L-threonylcarbamoyladenylate synthase [Polyangiaceae bacterium]